MDLHPALLGIFGVVVVIMMLLDLGVFHKKDHVISTKEALIWTIVWIVLSMGFSVAVWKEMGANSFYEYQSAYWIEKTLSIDNIFVFLLIFRQFRIPPEYQHRVLFYGIIGAIVFRAIFIFAGIELVHHTYLPPMDFMGFKGIKLNIVLLIFGIILVVAGIKSLLKPEEEPVVKENFKQGLGMRLVNRFLKMTNEMHGHDFFTFKNGIRYATPLFTALVIIEISDLIFAVDSVPAIFSVSKDPIILYTSNIFAIMGLRSLYFVLASFIHKFRLLHYGLAGILIFIGIKMIIEPFYEIHSLHSLIVIGTFLIISVLTSIFLPEKKVPNSQSGFR